MGAKELFHSVATGSRRRRQIFTPLGLTFFGLTLLVVVFGGLYLDRLLAFRPLLPGATGLIIGVLLLAPGAALWLWCIVHFARFRGTPVPFNPPKALIVAGPYLWVRNPMLTGVFACLFGVGFLLHSISIVAIWTPLYIVAHVIELKRIEEPELEMRFGVSYVNYKREVPMFIPRRPAMKNGQRLVALVFPVVLLAFGSGCSGTESRPEFAAAPERFTDVESLIVKTLDDRGLASIAVAVAVNGEIAWEAAYGWANREERVAATPNTVYALASISKAMTATGLMVLVERGLIDLDRPANDYLRPRRLTAFVGNADDATVRRLVAHTAGLPAHWNIFTPGESHRPPPMEESIARYGFLVTLPGSTYTYSNFGYGILGHIISQVTGKDHADFMRDAVFLPLGLTSTSVGIEADSKRVLAQMYAMDGTPVGPYDYDHRGASAVMSSVHDLVRFGIFQTGHRLPDQESILSNDMLKRMREEVVSSFEDSGNRTVNYLLGSFAGVELDHYHIQVATGGMPGAASRLALVPSEGVVTALVANGSVDLWPIERLILRTLLPNFVGDMNVSERVDANHDRTSFLGAWRGEITTYAGPIAVDVRIPESGEVSMSIRNKRVAGVPFSGGLERLGFYGGVYRGLFMARIDTPDATRSPQVVLVELRRRGGRLIGTATAVARNELFGLPYYMELSLME